MRAPSSLIFTGSRQECDMHMLNPEGRHSHSHTITIPSNTACADNHSFDLHIQPTLKTTQQCKLQTHDIIYDAMQYSLHIPQLNSNHQTRPNHVLIHFIIPHINTHSIPLFLLTVGTKKSTKFQYNRDPFLSSLLQEKPTEGKYRKK